MATERARDIASIFREGSRIDAAIWRAARQARLAVKREGLALPVWRDGKTVWIPPQEIEIQDEEAVPAADSSPGQAR